MRTSPLKRCVSLFLITLLCLAAVPSIAEEEAEEPGETVRIVFVGDSRCVGMRLAADGEGENLYVCEGGKSWGWYTGSAEPKLRQLLTENPGCAAVIMMGVNDCFNRACGARDVSALYAASFLSLREDFPDTPLFFCSVNPVDGQYRYDRLQGHLVVHLTAETFNPVIAAFNETVRSLIGEERYLDCSGVLGADAFITTDGIHYTPKTYRSIFRYCTDEVQSRILTDAP